MALDPRYIAGTILQEALVGIDGTALSLGYVFFYKDSMRSTLKTIYKLTGDPSNYSYQALPNPSRLNVAGVFVDETGNEVLPYFLPYDSNNNIERYYVVITDSNGDPLVPVITLSAMPPNVAEILDAQELNINHIPNGQFLNHVDLPAYQNYQAGQIRSPTGITVIGAGSWTFERPADSTATDIVLFDRFVQWNNNPAASPRYAVRVQCQSPDGGDDYKDVRVKFKDVNTFSSDTDQFTFALTGINNLTGSLTVQLILIKNFGTGGDATTERTLASFIFNTTYTVFPQIFIFGSNLNKVLGTLDDDYLQLALRFPSTIEFDASFTCVLLTPGAVQTPIYPFFTQSEGQGLAIANFMPVPNPDGSDLYLPLRLTPLGIEYDHSDVGKIYPAIYITPKIGELACFGDQYRTADYTQEGIPYSRIQAELWSDTYNIPVFGTGLDFVTAMAIFTSNTAEMLLSTNSAGVVTNTADGSPATTFTFATIHKDATPYYLNAYMQGSGLFNIATVNFGLAENTGAGNSGFTVTKVQKGLNNILPAIWQLQTIAASGITASHYFLADSVTPSISPVLFYVWFKIDGTGTDPAVSGRTPIEVDLLSTDTGNEVAIKIMLALRGYQLSTIIMVAASSITSGAYWIFSSTGGDQNFYVWYNKDSAGNDPKPANKVGIEVDIVSADTAAQVATKTQIAINKLFFAAPDLRGYFIRGWDNGAGNDPDAATRYCPYFPTYLGDLIGTYQQDQNISHNHATEDGHSFYTDGVATGAQGGGDHTLATNPVTGYSGGLESRSKNIAFNYIIKI